MARIRITATPPGDDVPADLADLARALHEVLQPGQHLRRTAGLALPGAPAPQPVPTTGGGDRVFILDVPDGDLAADVLRALGGWAMRHPSALLSIKADGPGGGVSLRLDGWSAVAFAAAAARVQAQLQTPEHPHAGDRPR